MNSNLSGNRGLPKNFPVADFLGINFISQSDGRAVAEFRAETQHANPMGTLHGGILCDLADAAMGVAFAGTLQPDESFTTLELKINFFDCRRGNLRVRRQDGGLAAREAATPEREGQEKYVEF